jgi:putative DNA primase/helicase
MSLDPQARLVLEVGDETEIARILLGEHPFFDQGPAAPLFGVVFDEGALWKIDEHNVWQIVDDAHVYRLVMAFSGMPKPSGDATETPLKVSAGFCRGVRQQVEALSAQHNFFVDGAWGMAFRGNFLRISRDGSATLEALTPEHRVRFALDFDYDPNAPCPEQWIAFLQSIWGEPGGFTPEGLESVNLLLEWLGYLLSGRTDYQKIMLTIGPPRSGKGTILRVVQRIFGDAATPFKVATLGERFQTGALAGKTLAYDPDVRRAAINDGSESKSVEMLISISGEDTIPIEQKYKGSFKCRLPARLWLNTNPPFKMTDVGAALSTRFVLLTMDRSFLGKEDIELEGKLAAEIPGIVMMALLALRNLSERGRFIEPSTSAETREAIEIAETPLLAFLKDRCEMGSPTDPAFQIRASALYQELVKWCEETGHRKPSDTTFSESLKKLGVKKVRKAREGRPRVYEGIKLLPDESAPGTPKFKLAAAS